jgi:hypothetical protein
VPEARIQTADFAAVYPSAANPAVVELAPRVDGLPDLSISLGAA